MEAPAQRRGIEGAGTACELGGQLLDQGMRAARTDGLVVSLDTMNAANVPFYEAHGLSVRHEGCVCGSAAEGMTDATRRAPVPP